VGAILPNLIIRGRPKLRFSAKHRPKIDEMEGNLPGPSDAARQESGHAKRQLVTAITGRSAGRAYGRRQRTKEIPMLTTRYCRIRNMIDEWRRRARSRRELTLLKSAERRDLAFCGDVNAELKKWFWQA
jgi:uncharacterized protein YjiS (DUF1127 family)